MPINKNLRALKEVIKEVCGDDCFEQGLQFTDKLKSGYKFKMQPYGMDTDKQELIIQKYKEKTGLDVKIKEGCSGGRMLPFVAFHIPPNEEV